MITTENSFDRFHKPLNLERLSEELNARLFEEPLCLRIDEVARNERELVSHTRI